MKVIYQREVCDLLSAQEQQFTMRRCTVDIPKDLLNKMSVFIDELTARVDKENYDLGIHGEYSGCLIPLTAEPIGKIPQSEAWVKAWHGVSVLDQSEERTLLIKILNDADLIYVEMGDLRANSLGVGAVVTNYINCELSSVSGLQGLAHSLKRKLSYRNPTIGNTHLEILPHRNEIRLGKVFVRLSPGSKQHAAIEGLLDCEVLTPESVLLDTINAAYHHKYGKDAFKDTGQLRDAYWKVKEKFAKKGVEYFPAEYRERSYIYNPD